MQTDTGSFSPWLSVVVPTYNGARYLKDTLESLMAQTEQEFEVLLIDDGSADNTEALAKSYVDKLPIRILRTERTGSWTENTNRALCEARGEFISILHQDDTWLPNRIEVLRTTYKHFPKARVIVHNAEFIDEQSVHRGCWTCPFHNSTEYLDGAYILERLFIQNFLAVPAVTFKRSTLQDTGTFDPSLWYTGDWDMWLRLAEMGNWIFVPKVLASFRIHRTSQTLLGSDSVSDYDKQYKAITARHSQMICRHVKDPEKVLALAELSSEINLFLMQLYKKSFIPSKTLIIAFWRSGTRGFLRYLYYSRLVERIKSRLTLLTISNPKGAERAY